jgi:hypothetical protein
LSLSEALATWEDYEALRQRFPDVTTWGQVVPYGGRNVTPSADQAGKNEGAGQVGHHKSNKSKKPNPWVTGPEWVCE